MMVFCTISTVNISKLKILEGCAAVKYQNTDFLSILICFAPSDFRSRPNIVLS